MLKRRLAYHLPLKILYAHVSFFLLKVVSTEVD